MKLAKYILFSILFSVLFFSVLTIAFARFSEKTQDIVLEMEPVKSNYLLGEIIELNFKPYKFI